MLVELDGTDTDEFESIRGTWMVRGPLPVFEPGDVEWPGDLTVHEGRTPCGRDFRAASLYVRDWAPDAAFSASLDRVLDDHLRGSRGART